MKVFANLDKIKDSARELLKAWEIRGFCEIKESPDDHIWIEKVGKICLFDLTVFKNLNQRAKDAELIILGNKDFGEDLLPNMVHGIFWARHPIELEKFVKKQEQDKKHTSWKLRKVISSGFFQCENQKQYLNRNLNWAEYLDDGFVKIIKPGEKIISHTDYLNRVRRSKYSLDLPGFGLRCNRMVEVLANRCVLLLPDNYYKNFSFPFEEGKHFKTLNNPESLIDINRDEDILISDEGFKIWERHFSVEGSFDTISNIIKNA